MFHGLLLTSVVSLLILNAMACKREDEGFRWLKGSTKQKLIQLEEQHAGFSTTMIEVAHRYSELYWAGEDQNWGYAAHQVEHIGEALELGIKRRPARAASSAMIFPVLEELEQNIEDKDPEGFKASFAKLTDTCNRCHVAEGEEAIIIGPPPVRTTILLAPR